MNSPQRRVIAYIDGFNLYFGMRDARLYRCYWLNVRALAENLLKPDQHLVRTKYFTARIAGPPKGDTSAAAQRLREKRLRQSVYLEALGTVPELDAYYGHYLGQIVTCHGCGRSWPDHEEKMTDVNVATEMLTDAFADHFDVALLISADSDLVPPIRAIRSLFPHCRVVVAFPPKRYSAALAKIAHGYLYIEPHTLSQSQLPDQVRKPDGFTLQRPKTWR